VFDPIFYPGRYPAGKIFLTHGSARAEPICSVGPTRSNPRKKKNPSKKPIEKKNAKKRPGHSPTLGGAAGAPSQSYRCMVEPLTVKFFSPKFFPKLQPRLRIESGKIGLSIDLDLIVSANSVWRMFFMFAFQMFVHF
jgi:hypothetical protein